ncbi:hypothetical protein SUGI_0820700 [Cryptomeria japonica]|nr:hypothetical protein SUGI_0820700 [Cryptomeria japonica]
MELSEIVNKLKAARLPMVGQFENQIQENFHYKGGVCKGDAGADQGTLLGFYADQGLRDVYGAACQAGLFKLLAELSPRDIVHFACWAKKGEGRQIVERQQRENKLKPKAIAGHTVGDVAAVELLDAEASVLSQEMKRTRAKYEEIIDELRAKIAKAQREMNHELRKLDDKYMAAARYNFGQKHATEDEKDNRNTRNHKAEFCKQDLIRHHLKEFCKREIKHYKRREKEQLWMMPHGRRVSLLIGVPVGKREPNPRNVMTDMLINSLSQQLSESFTQKGARIKEGLTQRIKVGLVAVCNLRENPRVQILVVMGSPEPKAIATAQTHYETGLRKSSAVDK